MATIETERMSPPTEEKWRRVWEALFEDVTFWARDWPGNGASVYRNTFEEDRQYGIPSVEVLMIDVPSRPEMLAPKEALVFEPKLLNQAAKLGVVDFYILPAHHRVRLLYSFDKGAWSVKTDSALYWPHEWGKETFIEIAEGFLDG